MDPIAALDEQMAELADLLGRATAEDWQRPSPCAGWTVADVVLHLAQTNELAAASARGAFPEAMFHLTDGLRPATSVDEGVEAMVARERGASPGDLYARWQQSARATRDALAECDPSARVVWVAGELSARTLATTRLAETWIHTTDIAAALSVPLVPGERLALIARLAWRTLPYAFSLAGRGELAGPVAFELTSPDGGRVDFVPDAPAITTIKGPLVDLCLLAGRRIEVAATSLEGFGPDAESVLELVRTYA